MSKPIQVPAGIGGPVFGDRFQISRWHAAPRQQIAVGDLLVTLESEQAVWEIEAADPGELEILVPEGKFVSVGETIAILHAS